MLELIIKRIEKQRQIVLVEDGKIIEYYEEAEDDNKNEGNIYIGVVKDIVKGMQAAFVDIGIEKNSLIHLKDILEKKDEKKEKTNIVPVIEQQIKSMQVLAEEKHITFSLIKEPDLPEIPINVDSIERALNNLLSNAIKYSPENGRIKVRAELARDPNFVEVSVEDQGCGIPEEHQKKIFERFYRVENDTHTVKGTGLGLHLVKITIEKHHQGEVFVKSKPGEGSTFGFRLPINPVEKTEEDDEIQ